MNEDRRLTCWMLRKLPMPPENKVALLLPSPLDTDRGARVLRALTHVIGRNLPESYICCICLLNLTCGPPRSGGGKNARVAAHYVPPTGGAPPLPLPSRRRSDDGGARMAAQPPPPADPESSYGAAVAAAASLPLSNPSLLVRLIERVMYANAPHAFGPYLLQGEAVRWLCGLVWNLTRARGVGGAGGSRGGGQGGDNDGDKTPPSSSSLPTSKRNDGDDDDVDGDDDDEDEDAEGVCALISRTGIPGLMVRLIDESPRPTVEWTRNLLRDACLGAMCNMAVWRESQEALRRAGASKCLRRLDGLPGIHGYRARAIRCGLGALSPLLFDRRAVSSFAP
jgi:hypothetical protein